MTDERYPSALGQPVELSEERRAHILDRHLVIALFLERIGDVLLRPEAIRHSTYDPQVFLLSRFYPDILDGKYLVVVVKTNERHFVLTVYLARRLSGE